MLCIIPARKGSKRLKNKNLRMLGGLYLYEWTFNIAKDFFTHVVVTSDDDRILNVAEHFYNFNTIKRPHKLCEDFSTESEFITHTLRNFSDPLRCITDEIVILYPTVPFRTSLTMEKILGQWKSHRNAYNSLRTVKPVSEHPYKMFEINDNELYNPFSNSTCLKQDYTAPTQSFDPYYIQVPYLYIYKVGKVKEPILPYLITDPKEGLDINTQEDWWLAEKYADSTT